VNWAWLVGFLLIQVAIGVWASRRIQSEEDYFVAGRRLGTPVLALSLFATWFGAETCLGASGAVYSDGLSGARADPLGYALCLVLMGLFLAVRFSEGRFLTLGDLYRRRYGVPAERLAVAIIVPSTLIWGAAQVRALGHVLASTSALPVETAVLVSAVLVVAYTFVGGLMGDVATDVVQGLFLSFGLVVLLVVSLSQLTGGAALDAALSADRLRIVPRGESVWMQLDRWSVPILGSLVSQELIARVLAARSPAVARRASLISCGVYLVVGAAPIALGLLGPALLPGLSDPEQLLPTLAAERLPHALYMLFSCSLMAAILSTIDSILLSASALLSHNILVPVLRAETRRQKLWLGRGAVVAAGAFAYVVALHASTVYDLVETASTFGTAGILVTTVGGLFWKRGNAPAAIAALLLGLVTTPIAEYVFELSAPFLTTIGVAASSYVAVSLATRRPRAGSPTA
jgi:SSS family transporter